LPDHRGSRSREESESWSFSFQNLSKKDLS
jgi:hypothetical protein